MGRTRVAFLLVAAGFSALLGGIVGLTAREDDRPIAGFSTRSFLSQRNLEQRVKRSLSADRIRADHRFLTDEPHVAGTPRDRELAEWTAAQWRNAGLEDVRI